MCDGFSAVMAAISVASAVAGTVSSQVQANAQYQQAQSMAATDDYNAKLAALEAQDLSNKENAYQAQERIAIAQEKMNQKKSILQRSATFAASSSAGGNSLSDVMNEYERMYGEQSHMLDQQLGMLDIGHNSAREAYKVQAERKIAGMSDIYITPLGLTTGLNIASGVLDVGNGIFGAVNEYKGRTKDRSNLLQLPSVSSGNALRYGKKNVWDASNYKLGNFGKVKLY